MLQGTSAHRFHCPLDHTTFETADIKCVQPHRHKSVQLDECLIPETSCSPHLFSLGSQARGEAVYRCSKN